MTDPFTFKTIDGAHYRCRKLPALKALQLTTELVRHLGDMLATILAGATSESFSTWAVVQYIARDGLTNLYPEAASSLMLRLMESVYIDGSNEHLGTEQRFNSHFDNRPGGIMTAMEVWIWALEVNFRNFFDAASSRLSQGAQGVSNTPISTMTNTSDNPNVA